ncbi:MAG: hypothetical protein DBX55_09475 [Verrucomicrobia bacterium]|nr:MAG: hypothetical protein DBX55_09475 [Verrucomicrobiota bacterium]
MQKLIKNGKKLLAAAAALACAPAFAQLDKALTVASANTLEEMGTLKTKTSKQVGASRIGIGFECLDREVFDPSKVYDKIGATGVKHARCQTGWARTEKQKGQYDFKWLDDVVDNLRARGIQPWFNVGYGNPLYMGKTDNPTAVGHVPLYYGDECLQAWKNYVRALAEHFKGRVFEYEIWNEPNIKKFWQPRAADAAEYAKFIEITAKEIKAADPDAKIGACKAGGFDAYFKKFMQNDAARELDFFSVHPYCMVPELGYDAMIAGMRTLIAASGGKMKIRQGEAGYPAHIPPDSWVAKGSWYPSNEDIQAKWMLRRFVADLSNDLEMSSFFMVIDFNSNYKVGGGGAYDEAVWGIMENGGDYRTRKAYDVLKNFCALFDARAKPADYYIDLYFGNVFPPKAKISRLTEVAASAACKSFDLDGWPLYAYYIPEDLQMRMNPIENVSLRWASDAPKPIKKPVLIDMMTGKVYKMKKGWQGVPITDYPLFVTDEDAVADSIAKK